MEGKRVRDARDIWHDIESAQNKRQCLLNTLIEGYVGDLHELFSTVLVLYDRQIAKLRRELAEA